MQQRSSQEWSCYPMSRRRSRLRSKARRRVSGRAVLRTDEARTSGGSKSVQGSLALSSGVVSRSIPDGRTRDHVVGVNVVVGRVVDALREKRLSGLSLVLQGGRKDCLRTQTIPGVSAVKVPGMAIPAGNACVPEPVTSSWAQEG